MPGFEFLLQPEPMLVWTSVLKTVVIMGIVLTMVAYSVWAERKVSAFIQDRVGPNRVGWAGLIQPIADGVKLLLKENFVPAGVNKFYFSIAPSLAMVPAILVLAVLPFGSTLFGVPMVIADLNIGILWVFAVSSLGVYGIVLAGWASNSKYPFLGGIRSSSQMISYELALGLSVYPSVAASAALPASASLAMAVPLVALEFGVGVFIGFMASMPLLAAQFGGLTMGQQIGLGFARFYNPAIGDESDALEQLLFFLALATFIALGGIESMFSSVVASFVSLPGGAVPAMIAGTADISAIGVFTGALSGAFEIGLRVAAPLLAIVCLETVVMGYLSRSVPQLNVLSVGFPVRIVVGLGVIIASLAAIDGVLRDGTIGAIDEMLIASGAVEVSS